MIETIVLFLLVLLAAIGTVALGNIAGGYMYEKEVKRKEQFKRYVLDIIKEYKEKTDA